MRIGRSNRPAGKTQVVVLTADAGFEEQARATFGASHADRADRGLRHDRRRRRVRSSLDDATVAVIDLDAVDAGRDGRRSNG